MLSRVQKLRSLESDLRSKVVEARLTFLNDEVEDGQDGTEFDCDVLNLLRDLDTIRSNKIDELVKKYDR